MYLALYARRAWVIFDHPYNADSARIHRMQSRVDATRGLSVMRGRIAECIEEGLRGDHHD